MKHILIISTKPENQELFTLERLVSVIHLDDFLNGIKPTQTIKMSKSVFPL